MHGNLLKFLNIFKLYFCFFLLLGKKIYLSGETAIVVTSRGTSCNIWKQPCCTSWVAVAVISSTGEVCRGYSRLLPICDAFFYSTWPSFSTHIKKEVLSNRRERRWPQNKTGVVHRYQATVAEGPSNHQASDTQVETTVNP